MTVIAREQSGWDTYHKWLDKQNPVSKDIRGLIKEFVRKQIRDHRKIEHRQLSRTTYNDIEYYILEFLEKWVAFALNQDSFKALKKVVSKFAQLKCGNNIDLRTRALYRALDELTDSLNKQGLAGGE